MRAARRSTSASSRPQQTTWAAERRSDPGSRPRSSQAGADPDVLGLRIGQRREGEVELVGVGGGKAWRARCPVPAHDEGWVRSLGRLGQGGTVLEVEVVAVEAELLVVGRPPQTGEDGEGLLQALEALAQGRELEAVGGVLGVVPAGAQAELDPAARHVVDLGHLDGEQAGWAEGGAGDEGAQPDALGLTGDGTQGQPGVGRPGQTVAAHGEEVVRAEEGVEACGFGRLGHAEEGPVGRTLLGFDEDAKQHGGQRSRALPVPVGPGQRAGVGAAGQTATPWTSA